MESIPQQLNTFFSFFFNMTNKKLILISFFVVAIMVSGLVIFTQYYEIISKPTQPLKNAYPVNPILADMTISFSNGDILAVEISEKVPAIIIDVVSVRDGRLIIDDPINNLKKAFPDSKFDGYTILVDGNEVAVDEISFNVVAISVKENSQRIEIVPFIWIPGIPSSSDT